MATMHSECAMKVQVHSMSCLTAPTTLSPAAAAVASSDCCVDDDDDDDVLLARRAYKKFVGADRSVRSPTEAKSNSGNSIEPDDDARPEALSTSKRYCSRSKLADCNRLFRANILRFQLLRRLRDADADIDVVVVVDRRPMLLILFVVDGVFGSVPASDVVVRMRRRSIC